MRIAVIGAGSWGTALASILGKKHEEVFLWARSAELAAQIQKIEKTLVTFQAVSYPQL